MRFSSQIEKSEKTLLNLRWEKLCDFTVGKPENFKTIWIRVHSVIYREQWNLKLKKYSSKICLYIFFKSIFWARKSYTIKVFPQSGLLREKYINIVIKMTMHP